MSKKKTSDLKSTKKFSSPCIYLYILNRILILLQNRTWNSIFITYTICRSLRKAHLYENMFCIERAAADGNWFDVNNYVRTEENKHFINLFLKKPNQTRPNLIIINSEIQHFCLEKLAFYELAKHKILLRRPIQINHFNETKKKKENFYFNQIRIKVPEVLIGFRNIIPSIIYMVERILSRLRF